MIRRRGPFTTVAASVFVMATLGAGLAACSDDGDASATTGQRAETIESTVPADHDEAADVEMEVDVPTALTTRLAEELGDPTLATEVVAKLSPETLAVLEAKVTPEEIGTSPSLAYRPETTAGPVDHLVVLAFGNRPGLDGEPVPGPTNEALADSVQKYVATDPTPVYAQWEVATILKDRGVPDVVSIEPVVAEDGTVTYLSTSGVTDQVVEHARSTGEELGRVGIVGFADHVVRCVMTAAASGMSDVVVVEGLALPTAYDPESGQEWTRERSTYLSTDLSSRIAAL